MVRPPEGEQRRETANSATQGKEAQDSNQPQRGCVRGASNTLLPGPARSSSFFNLLSLRLHLAYQVITYG